jgi:hypothetical protein
VRVVDGDKPAFGRGNEVASDEQSGFDGLDSSRRCAQNSSAQGSTLHPQATYGCGGEGTLLLNVPVRMTAGKICATPPE